MTLNNERINLAVTGRTHAATFTQCEARFHRRRPFTRRHHPVGGGSPPHGALFGAGADLNLTWAEIVGGIVTGSLALIADAAHMATDAGGLALALLAIHFAQKGPNAAKKLTVICVPRSSLH